MTIDKGTARPMITHPILCLSHPKPSDEQTSVVRGDCLRDGLPSFGTHHGADYRLDAGPTAASVLTAQAIEDFELLEGKVLSHGPEVELTARHRERLEKAVTVRLSTAEVERLTELLGLATRDGGLDWAYAAANAVHAE